MHVVTRSAGVLLVLAIIGMSWGAKPAPPPATPPGTIYFAADGALRSMNGSGGSQAVVFVGNQPYAASQARHNGRRWFLVGAPDPSDGENEIWATPDNVTFIQLTNYKVIDNGDGTETIFRNSGWPSWSNNGLDSFVSISYVFGTRVIATGEVLDYEQGIAKLSLGAAELEAIWADETIPDPRLYYTSPLVVPTVTTPSGRPHFEFHHWSPDSNFACYIMADDTNDYELRVADVSAAPVDGQADGLMIVNAGGFLWAPQWSRHANPADWQIAYTQFGQLRTIRPDGTGVLSLTTSGSTANTTPYWSPDSQYLAYRRSITKGFTTKRYIERIPATGGSPLVLYTGDALSHKSVVGWSD